MNYGVRFVTLCRRQGSRLQEKEMQKSKMAVWEALQIAVKRREAKITADGDCSQDACSLEGKL